MTRPGEPMTYLDALAMTPNDDDPATLLHRFTLAAAAARDGATEAEIDRALAGHIMSAARLREAAVALRAHDKKTNPFEHAVARMFDDLADSYAIERGHAGQEVLDIADAGDPS